MFEKIRTFFIYKLDLITFLSLLSATLFYRFYKLSDRAIHHDESLHGYFAFTTSLGDVFHHNPLTHGMFLFNFLSSFFWLFGDSNLTLRLPFAFFGLLVVFLPFLFRNEIGRLTTLLISLMLIFSPSIAYFSRFARNDIFIAVFFIIFMISTIKYIKSSDNKWLYLSIASLSFGFTTKETMYINLFGVLLFLFAYSYRDILSVLMSKISIKQINNHTKLFLILFTISLPLAAPLIAIFQSSLGLILAAPEGYPSIPPGLPIGNGLYLSLIITMILCIISLSVGLYLDKKIWINSTIIFLTIYVLMFTSFFINPSGIISGQWQSLGYWLSQQEVARGSQPIYYYFLLCLSYEFLPFVIGLPVAFYYLYKGDFTKKYFGFISIYSLLAFTLAGEKMPWLLVNITIPFIFITGMFVSDNIKKLFTLNKEILLFILFASFLILFFLLRLIFSDYSHSTQSIYYDLLFFSLLILVSLFANFRYGIKLNLFLTSLVIVFFIMFSIFTVRTTNMLLFKHSDEPRDALIYTQTSSELHFISQELNNLNYVKNTSSNISVAVDTSDGFAWPWMWYLRNFKDVIWFDSSSIDNIDYEVDILLMNKNQIDKISDKTLYYYDIRRPYSHRKWFPEHNYRNLSFDKIFEIVINNDKRVMIRDFFISKKFHSNLGSSDAILYKSKEFKSLE